MIVEFLPQARTELHDAVSYYEGELSGLGLRFWDEVDQHIACRRRSVLCRSFNEIAESRELQLFRARSSSSRTS
jgi:hypothetical protein